MRAQAQGTGSLPAVVVSQNPEHQAAPGAGRMRVTHTGTDAIICEDNGQPEPQIGNVMQVMTWDEGNDVYLSWDFFDNLPTANSVNNRVNPDARGEIHFSISAANLPDQAPDPDVVLAYHDDPLTGQRELFANLVYISGNKTMYKVYRWETAARTFALYINPSYANPRQLGNRDFDHSYPNIDSNRDGLIAVTWQQTVTTTATINVSSQSGLFPSYTINQLITFGRAVVAGGDIVGNFRDCYYDDISSNYGMYVLNPPTGLFEQTLHPDVAISEGTVDGAIISSVFVRHYVDGTNLFSIHNNVMVVQTRYGQCRDGSEGNPTLAQLDVFASKEWPYSDNAVIGTPRIAATGFYRSSPEGTDVEVAIDRQVPNCGPAQYAIWNYGKSAGAFRPNYTLVSPADNLIKSVEPVVAYSVLFDPSPTVVETNTYAISWTGGTDSGPNYGPDNEEDDVFAVAMLNGRHYSNGTQGPNAYPGNYSRLNKFGGDNQRTASIAGRHISYSGVYSNRPTALQKEDPEGTPHVLTYFVHLFYDEAQQQLSYRRSKEMAGSQYQLRPGRGAGASPSPGTGTSLLQAYPNPSEGTVKIALHLHPGEQVRRLTVQDALGRTVAELSVPVSGPAEWQPAATQPAGLYTVRASTSERTATVAVERK